MTRLTTLLCAWLCAMAFVVAAGPAQAQTNYVSYVSVNGSDANNCSTPALACGDFVTALNNTRPFGEIDCLNAGNYAGSLPIAQSVTIDCAGGGQSTLLGPITVNGAGIVVRLRNLSINSTGTGYIGIDGQNMAALYIENCVITNSNGLITNVGTDFVGIKFHPSTGLSQLFVTNSIISNNGHSGGITGGIYVVPASGVTAEVSIDKSQITGNVFGIAGDGTSGGTVKGTISDSVVSGNSEDGIAAISSGSAAWFLVDQTKVAGNAYGLAAGGSGAEILARNSSIFDNSTGLHTGNGGAIYTYGTNSVNGNATNGAFTGTVGLQ
jgi:hypothetical protein